MSFKHLKLNLILCKDLLISCILYFFALVSAYTADLLNPQNFLFY